MMLTGNPGPNGAYTGAAYEGIGLLPAIGKPCSSSSNPSLACPAPRASPCPSRRQPSGASLSIITRLLKEGLADQHDIAVFTAMCMCLSGYLSTHVAMMKALGFSKLTGKAILSHTVGGIFAGVFAHLLISLIRLF